MYSLRLLLKTDILSLGRCLVTLPNIHNILIPPLRTCNLNNTGIKGYRNLYNAASLGIDGFLNQNARVRDEVVNKDTFLQKLEELKSTNTNELTIYTEDIRILIALCQEDQELLNDVLVLTKRYYDKIKTFNLRPFSFGPIIMRLLYIHDLPDVAMKVLLDKEYDDLFNQVSSYHIVMDLLYKKNRFEDVKRIMAKIILENRFPIPISCSTLAFAANYKLSTEDALEDSLRIIRILTEMKRTISLRSIGFSAGLALNLEKPHFAMEILAYAHGFNHFLVNNLYLLTRAQLGRISEVLSLLRTKTLQDSPKSSNFVVKHIYSYDVIDKIEKIVNHGLEMEMISEFNHLKKVLHNMNMISQESLDLSICSPVEEKILHKKDNFSKPHRRSTQSRDTF